MFEKRNLRLDLAALALFALTVFFAVSLVSYHRADPVGAVFASLSPVYQPDVLVYPPNEKIGNACGRWGSLAADLLLNGLGLGAYYLVLSAGVLDFALLRRRTIDAPIIRGIGWLMSLLAVTTLLSMLVPGWTPGPVVGSGGYLGALGRGWLELHFATFGGFILTASLLIGGLLLCTDYWLVRASLFAFGLVSSVVSRDRKPASADKSKNMKPGKQLKPIVDDLSSATYDDDDDDEFVPIKFRGKAVAEDDESDEFEDEDDELAARDDTDELDDAEVEEDERKSVLATSTALAETTNAGPHFRVRRGSDKVDREKVLAELDASEEAAASTYELPSLDLLIPGEDFHYEEQEKEVRRKAKILEKTFADFGFKVRVVEIETGPVIAQYEVELEAGLRLSKITSLADDLAIALRVPSVRIVAPIPGKNTVGIEVPNEERQVVRLREVIEETNGKISKMRIPIFLGKDVSGNALTVDLSTLPHLLIAGRTGTGKSVCLNAIISSILMTRRPDEVRMLMIDPKMVELSGYARLPHLMHPVVTDMKKAEAILAWAVEKMEERYALLARAGVRHIASYNQLGENELVERLQPEDEESRKRIPLNLPFIVIVADEIADMMMTAGKEVEQHIIRLAQKSRAVGIHLILATQKPTVDVITGLIKSNLPARISFQVASRVDSRVVLDEMGADKLLGNGDMLFLWPGTSTMVRGQGTYLSDDEINKVVAFCSQGQPQNFVSELVNLKVEAAGEEGGLAQLKKRDELYESAIDVVVREGRGSVSLLQRTLGIGYGRAARLIDFMAEDNLVGQYAGSQAREVLISLADWERMQGQDPADAPEKLPTEPPPKPRRAPVVLAEPRHEGSGFRVQGSEENSRSPVAVVSKGTRQAAQKMEVWQADEEEHDEQNEQAFAKNTAPFDADDEDDSYSAVS